MTPLSFSLIALLAAPAVPAPGTAPHQDTSVGHELRWTRTWDDAVAAAKKLPEGRILIEFVEEGCADCRRMEGLVVPSVSFASFCRDKVPLQVIRSSPEGTKLAERLAVKVVPSWVVVTPEMVVSGMQTGPTSQYGWFDAFRQSEEGWAAYKKLLAEEQAHPEKLDTVMEVARQTYQRRGDLIAEGRFKRIGYDEKAPQLLREESLTFLASIRLDSNRVEEAGKDLETLLALTKSDALRERVELRLADVEIGKGRPEKAVARLRDFKAAHPSSPLVAEADELLKAIEARAGGAAEGKR